ncbi:MAG: serine protease, partial [Bacteroidales bacterium]|nr:serine protease [Bacteroidales bacterium]
IYISGMNYYKREFLYDPRRYWSVGDVYAYLTKTPGSSVFKTKFYSSNKELIDNSAIKFVNGNIRFYAPRGFMTFRRVFPDSSAYENLSGQLSGFTINKNRIVSCYHGFKEKDIKIIVKGINGNSEKGYEATIEKFDDLNDIAVLKLVDTTVTLDSSLFSLALDERNTAEEVFVLSYPKSFFMGEEIKLTNGIISSTSGYIGDNTTYQISAPVQGGSSGGPVFDKNGNLIGMINAKYFNADNVSYCIKSKNLMEFLNNNSYITEFVTTNSNQTRTWAERVKDYGKSIYLIEVIDTKTKRKLSRRK